MDVQGHNIFFLLLYGYLFLALSVSAITDLLYRRISNYVTFSTIGIALVCYSVGSGLPGLIFSLKGLSFGFVLLLPLYFLGGTGAGDVKLMAAVGAILGIEHTLSAFLLIMILGGIMALVMLVTKGKVWGTLRRLGFSLYALSSGGAPNVMKVDRATLRRDGIPYGVVIAAGTLSYCCYQMTIGTGLPRLVP